MTVINEQNAGFSLLDRQFINNPEQRDPGFFEKGKFSGLFLDVISICLQPP